MAHRSSSSSTATAQDTPLLKLSAEVRNSIYTLTLATEDSIDVTDLRTPTEPGLLCTCQQVRAEALGIYYSSNIFTLNLRECIKKNALLRPCGPIVWLEVVGTKRCILIATLELRYENRATVFLCPKSMLDTVVAEGDGSLEWDGECKRVLAFVAHSGVSLRAVKFRGPEKMETLEDALMLKLKNGGERALAETLNAARHEGERDAEPVN